MPAPSKEDIESLIRRILALRQRSGESEPLEQLPVLKKLGATQSGEVPLDQWARIEEAEKVYALETLQAILSSTPGFDEPANPDNIMFRAHASNAAITVTVASSAVIVLGLLWKIYEYWETATGDNATEPAVLRMVVLMGALGGTVHWMSSLATYIGNGNLFRRWIPYYLLAPLQGAALALVVYLLLRVGVLSSTSNSPKNLNLMGLYAFAGLTGLFAKQAIEMLRDVFSTIFKRIREKDAADGARAPANSKGAGESKSGATEGARK